jgi:oxygen-independent coproporphyrinogen-3 oxidase
MTRLRTQQGISLKKIENTFGQKMYVYVLQQAQTHIDDHLLSQEGDRLYVTKKGKFLSDGIASDLFLLNVDS